MTPTRRPTRGRPPLPRGGRGGASGVDGAAPGAVVTVARALGARFAPWAGWRRPPRPDPLPPRGERGREWLGRRGAGGGGAGGAGACVVGRVVGGPLTPTLSPAGGERARGVVDGAAPGAAMTAARALAGRFARWGGLAAVPSPRSSPSWGETGRVGRGRRGVAAVARALGGGAGLRRRPITLTLSPAGGEWARGTWTARYGRRWR